MLTSKEYKAQTDEYASMMKKYFEDSQSAWKSGDKAKAKDMSVKGNEYKALLMEANKNFTETLQQEKLQRQNVRIKENVISNVVQMKDLNDKINDMYSQIGIKENQESFMNNKNNQINELEKLSIEDSILKEYNYYREQASINAKEMGDAFTQAKISWEMGDKARAKELSNFGYQCKERIEIYNANAVKIIATKNNIEKDSDEIDLHGLYVNEAIQFFKETLSIKMKDKNFQSLKIIVGKGLHSKDKPKLKEAVVNFANEHNLNVFEHPDNPGCLIICVI